MRQREHTVTYTEPYRIYAHDTTTKYLNNFFYSFSLCVKRKTGELARPKSESWKKFTSFGYNYVCLRLRVASAIVWERWIFDRYMRSTAAYLSIHNLEQWNFTWVSRDRCNFYGYNFLIQQNVITQNYYRSQSILLGCTITMYTHI